MHIQDNKITNIIRKKLLVTCVFVNQTLKMEFALMRWLYTVHITA